MFALSAKRKERIIPPMKRIGLLALLLSLFAPALFAPVSPAQTVGERLQKLLGDSLGGGDAILHPEQAFLFSAYAPGPQRVALRWQVAAGYYLYRHRFGVDSAEVELGEWQAPRGELKQDETFGEVEVNTGQVEFVVPLLSRPQQGVARFAVRYQGCKENAVCYPPVTKTVSVAFPENPPAALATPATAMPAKATSLTAPATTPATLSAQDQITAKLARGGFLLNMLAFFIFGLLLSLTPCVFPMIPILSGIIVGQAATLSPLRGFVLSLIYVLSMSLVYALLGVIAGLFQVNAQAAAQNAWAIGAFSLVFVLLALSMFGLYPLQLPSAMQTKLQGLLDSQSGGGWSGVAAMGAVSAIIVGPCVAPPLAGALLYISQTGNAALGGAALFSMGIGFGAPLLLLGMSAGYLLPRAGAWMESVKAVFGVVMLAVAIWFLERIIPPPLALLLWGALFIVSALYLGALDRGATGWKKCLQGLGIVMLIYGGSLVLGAVGGGGDKFRPLQPFISGAGGPAHAALPFKRVKTLRQAQDEIRLAGANGERVLLDFYADWCVTCIKMERKTFADAAVREKLGAFVLLQADVTANDAEDRELLAHFNLYGPPAILFFDLNHVELVDKRLLGFVGPGDFLAHLDGVLF